MLVSQLSWTPRNEPFFLSKKSLHQYQDQETSVKISITGLCVREYLPLRLDDVPDVFNGITELATCYAGAQAVIAEADCVILEAVGEVIVSLSHGPNEDADALFWPYVLYVVFDPNDIRVKAECHLTAIGGQMVSDWVLYDFE